MIKQILIDSEKCTGCELCEMACAVSKAGICQPALARIKIWRDEPRGLFVPMTCQHCTNPPCASACLMNVISKDPQTGLTVRNPDGCIACRACQIACPFEASCWDYLQDLPVNCDLCGGDPQCVRYCPTGALQYSYPDEKVEQLRWAEAAKRYNVIVG